MQQTAVEEEFLSLRPLPRQTRADYMDPDNIPDQSKVVCVCSRITYFAGLGQA